MCGKEGVLIPNLTVKAILKNDLKERIGPSDYHLCVDKECDVAYFNTEQNFSTYDTKRPIWYKRDADPKLVCYCNNITEQQVIEVVLNEGITEMQDVYRFINGRIAKSNCKYLNPSGKCCFQAFNNAKDKAIAFKTGEKYIEPDYHA